MKLQLVILGYVPDSGEEIKFLSLQRRIDEVTDIFFQRRAYKKNSNGEANNKIDFIPTGNLDMIKDMLIVRDKLKSSGHHMVGSKVNREMKKEEKDKRHPNISPSL